jgi:acyl-CoA dehydrogenase
LSLSAHPHRRATIYEGANGIQALDLVGRKLPKDGGRAIKAFQGGVRDFISEGKREPALAEYLAPLEIAVGQLEQASAWIADHAKANPDEIGAASTEYLHLFGLTALAYMWAKIAKAVLARQAAGTSNAGLDAKLALARFFSKRVLPQSAAHLAKLQSGAEALMDLPNEMF